MPPVISKMVVFFNSSTQQSQTSGSVCGWDPATTKNRRKTIHIRNISELFISYGYSGPISTAPNCNSDSITTHRAEFWGLQISQIEFSLGACVYLRSTLIPCIDSGQISHCRGTFETFDPGKTAHLKDLLLVHTVLSAVKRRKAGGNDEKSTILEKVLYAAALGLPVLSATARIITTLTEPTTAKFSLDALKTRFVANWPQLSEH